MNDEIKGIIGNDAAYEVVDVLLSGIQLADSAIHAKSPSGVTVKASEMADQALSVILGMFARLPYNEFWQRHGAMLMGAISGAILARMDSYSSAADSTTGGMKTFLAQHYQALGVAHQIALLAGVPARDIPRLREAVIRRIGHDGNNS